MDLILVPVLLHFLQYEAPERLLERLQDGGAGSGVPECRLRRLDAHALHVGVQLGGVVVRERLDL